MRVLEIYRDGILAGNLIEENKSQFVFRYDDAYFLDDTKAPISLTLSKTQKEHRSEVLFPFFYNMLSEGANRKLQSMLWRIDENDSFALLMATAQYDTIGAVTVKTSKEL